ncbi:hypothetical protein JG688_00002322 [Phytophthora aleatoria]|uniref:C2 domain-containing protein n=1 Tax=Phytophthora aleatoria TaxID=2496075 RepID=A0A8J5MHV5_9STRA|nr:hypothetical protein JG688_00002322 [Phytophthora aleatoria]
MRSTKRASELPPLSVDQVSGRKPQRLNQLPTAADTASTGPRSLPKVYPRLETLSQLTNTYVRGLHTGNFVARSELRWQNFDGRDSPNSARDRTMETVKQSAALVIQCSWRRQAAVTERERLKVGIWRRQLDVAAKITGHSSCLTQAQHVLRISEKNRLQAVASIVPMHGFYFRAPAQLISWWLGFTCAQIVARRILRHPPVAVRTVDIPVRLTRGKLVQLWRYVALLAVLVLQCSIRVFLARQEVGKRRLEGRQLEAALRIQAFIRVYSAQHVARKLRRRCAAIRIQCLWRCHHARECLLQRRITHIATCVCVPLILQAAKQATVKLRIRSAEIIQKNYRGCRSRAQFRGLLSRHEQQKWRQNPSKGFDFFELQRYDQAALYLENCFRQGIFTEETMPMLQPGLMNRSLVRNTPQRKLVSGSRMSFSFSVSPTKLGTDWILVQDNSYDIDDLSSDVMRLAGRLQFWQAYAISHFRVFEATGNVFNLNQARVGWESYLQVDTVAKSWAPFQAIATSLKELRFRSQFELVRCMFWSGKQSEKDKALSLSLSLLQELYADTNDLRSLQRVSFSEAVNFEAKLLMLSSMLYFEQNLFAKSCSQLEKLLNLSSQTVFTDLEVRFTLALILLKRYEESFAGNTGAPKTDNPEINTCLRTSSQLLKQCYRVIELWPSVGFYHGRMEKSKAKRLLSKEQIGSFLLHHPIDATDTAEKILLQVKLSDRPLRVASMRIEFTATGVYKTRKMPDHLGHFSLHSLIANLPSEAGVQMELGIRKSIYTRSLQWTLERSQPELLHGKKMQRSRLLAWDEWERKLHETAAIRSDSDRRWKRRNETWSAVCLEVAKALECSEAWVFAELAVREALLHSKDRFPRANASFLAARVVMNTQKRNESALLMQQARLEMIPERSSPNTHLFIDNLTAVQRAWSLNVSISKQEPFSSRLERLQKLERLCLKAWQYDSLALRFRGDPFREALLLQRVADEMYAECGDTFFIRSLLKAHVRAYVGNDSWYEGLHLKCAYMCVAQLFKRFYTHQDSWTAHLTSLTGHFQDKTQSKKTVTKTRAFNVKLLLLSWHHMPFLLCFEMAEVLYRYKSHSASTLIDVYESLLGRLRGSQSQSSLYVAYEELFLLRLSFVHAAKVSQTEHSWPHLDAAVSAIDEIVEQRKNRSQLLTSEAVKKRAKRIKWPSSIRLPFYFSDAEVLFIRGCFVQLQEEMMRIPVERRRSWRDYHALHQELINLVVKSGKVSDRDGRLLNSVRYRAENLQGVRVFVGATHDVTISNMLLSHPFVAIRLEGQTTMTRSPPTWTNLSPSWEEDIEIPVSSARASITISVMNRARRNSRWQDADTIGYVSIAMHDLISAHGGITEGKYYELMLLKPPSQRSSRESEGCYAQIFLSFQVIVKPRPMLPPSAKRTATWATRSGNWDVEDVRAHLHGDLQVFVSSRWIWSRFACLFMQDKDLFIAKWFYVKAVRLTSELQRRTSKAGIRLNTTDSLAIVTDLEGLSRCYRVNLSDLKWGEQAIPLLGHAEAILTRKTTQQNHDYYSLSDRTELEKQLVAVRELLADARGTSKLVGPLDEALSRKTPATSEWVKITNRGPSGGISAHYFNQDTGETFRSNWRDEPLEYEDKETIVMEEQERLPHRIVVMSSEMKARVRFHRDQLLRLHADDPFHWVAVFNDRKKEFQFYSPNSQEAYSDPKATKYPARPPTYVMLADEFLLYHVLLVQDAYRKYHVRRQRQRRLRGVFLSVCLVCREFVATRRRIVLWGLNCVRVVVERAQHLRAGDVLSSDPFVKLTVTDPTGEVVATGETSVRYNSLNPKWNEEFHFRYSFTEHLVLQQTASFLRNDTGHLRQAVLTLKVFDYDVVSTRKASNKKQEFVDESDSSLETGHHPDQLNSPDDFLGMVTIPIQTFTHGMRMTADLPLLDEKGENNSPRTRGSLIISVQWTHCDEEDDKVSNVSKLWAISSGGGRLLVAKKEKDRPELPEEAAVEVDLLRQQMEQLLQLLLSMATEVLEPMYRLQNRMKIAQSKGKTAEEAKMLEQRLDGLFRTQLLPKLKFVRGLVAGQMDAQLPVVLKKLFGPIEEYLSSFDQKSRRELRSSMEKCLDELNSNTNFLKTTPAEGLTSTDGMNMALDQHQQVKIWNNQLREILKTFFIGDKAQWQFTLEEKVDEIYSKLSGGGSRRSEGKTTGRPATAAAVSKRKERIEKVKQEKAWYEL